MAKRKKRKNSAQKRFKYHTELNGLLMILIAVIAIGPYGPVGDIFSAFAIFLVGVYYQGLIALIFLMGGYMAIQKKWPKFMSNRLIGFYFFLLGVLIFSHLDYILSFSTIPMVFEETTTNFMNAIKGSIDIQGSGIIGGFLSVISVKLFAVEGTKIVSYALMGFGVIVFTGISFIDLLKKSFQAIRKFITKENKKVEKKIRVAEEEFENETVDKKVVISSLDELTEKEHTPVEEVDTKKSVSSEGYILPPLSLLTVQKKATGKENKENISNNIKTLERVFLDFSIVGEVVKVHIGPSVTQYEMNLKSGTKVNKVLGINREIALALAAKTIRIEAPIPGKRTIGVEVPNEKVSYVALRDILANISSSRSHSKLVFALGKNIMGRPIFDEIGKMPHLLVAGATGSGKSVCINAIVCSFLMRTKPDELKFLMIDPKKVELSVYNGIPHLLAPVVTNPKKASLALKRVVTEMERRYEVFEKSHTKNLAGYNVYVESKNKHLSDNEKIEKLPYIVVVIDELADLMAVASKEVEESIMRITQMARAAGIHLIIATQRPSTDVITGLIKSNIPSRISFAVSSSIDSRTILDMKGAEKLLGNGDMLFKPTGENAPIRVQGAFISDEEVKKVVSFVSKQQKASFENSMVNLEPEPEKRHNTQDEEYEEPLYNEIVEFVVTSQKASASLIQRRFRVGYNRAARIIDLLEERGIIGPNNGSKPRIVLVTLGDQEK